MLCVCVVDVMDVMDVVFYVCILRRASVCARVWEMRVVRHADIVCVCLVCILWHFLMLCLHDLQFVNAGQGCKRRPYGRGILQSWSHNGLVGSHECLLLFTPSCCSECFYDL